MNTDITADKNKILSLLEDAYVIRTSDLNKSQAIAEQALSLSRALNDNICIGRSLNQLSLFHMIKGEYEISTKMAKEAIIYFKALNDEKGVADARYNLAGVCYKTDNFHMGLVNLIDCLAIYRKYDDHHNQARVLKSLGTIYEFFGDEKNALSSYEQSITAAKEVGDIGLKSNAYNPLSGIYLKKGQDAKALEVIEKAIDMKKTANDIRGLAFSLYGRAKVFIKSKNYTAAENDLKESLRIHKEAGEKLGSGMAYRKLSVLYIAMGALEKAVDTLLYCLDFCEEHNIAILSFKCHYHLYEIYKQQGQTEKALTHLEQYLNQKETVINAQTLQVIENYELIKKMEALEKETQMQKEKAEIIEKKELAEKASKMKQDFLSTMSHEIRTPLNAVLTISSLLQDRSNEEDQELLESLRFAGDSLLHLVNDILDFTKLDTGNTKLEYRTQEIKPLIENVRKTYDSLAKAKGLKLFLNIDSELDDFYELDETKLSQILGNLIGNAIKYTEAGRVDIEVEKTGSENNQHKIKFKVTDTGIGISEKHFEDIFESFYQPYVITTRKQGGSGLGLSIVKKLVELHGSKVFLNSNVGRGSEFYFEILMTPSSPPNKTKVKQHDVLSNKTALLAEDNMLNAMVAIKLLSKWNIKTIHAKNGIEAVDLAKTQTYDFILMDIHMPEMNGFEATSKIRREINPNSNTPIFALTADITAEQQTEYTSYFNGFLRKPIEIEKMRDALSKI